MQQNRGNKRQQEIEELLNIVQGEDTPSSTIDRLTSDFTESAKRAVGFRKRKVISRKYNKVYNFIQKYDIKPGSHFYPAYVLYGWFREYLKKRPQQIFYLKFIQVMTLFYPSKRTKNCLFFGIDKNLYEDFLTAKKEAAWRRWYYEKAKKEKKYKRKTKVPRIRSEI